MQLHFPMNVTMPRKEKTIFTLLTELPWWLNLCFAIAVYILLAFVLPAFTFESPVAIGFVNGLHKLAPAFALLFLIPAVISAVNAWRKSRKS